MNNKELCERLREIYDKMDGYIDRLNSVDVMEPGIAVGHLEDELEKLGELIDEIDEEEHK